MIRRFVLWLSRGVPIEKHADVRKTLRAAERELTFLRRRMDFLLVDLKKTIEVYGEK